MEKNKGVIFALTVGVMLLSLTGCGGSGDNAMTTAESYDAGATDQIYSVENAQADTQENSSAVSVAENRKLVKTVNMNVETEEFDTLVSNVEARISKLGGYMESLDMGVNNGYGDYESSHYANITARIPKDQLDSFVEEIAETSNVISQSENTEDVTLQYVDVESHKKALETEQDRLLELLEKAENMEDIVTIESKLSDIRYQIESYTSQMRTFDNQVDYSTVYLYIEEVKNLTPQVEPGAFERIRQGFVNNVITIGKGIKNFVIEFIIFIPYLVLIGVIAVIVIAIFRAVSKKTDEKNKKRKEELQKKREEQEAALKKAEGTDGKPEL